jgi:hypothetical protein
VLHAEGELSTLSTVLSTESGLPTDPLSRYALFRTNPWLFLKHCVFTHDEVDAENPIKPFPCNLMYLYFLTGMWQKNKKMAIPKSRRMTVSWTFIGLTVWDCIFHKGRSWAFVSKKEEDSKELVSRAEFIYKHIPPEMISPDLLPKIKRGQMQSSPPAIEFEDIYSKIQGFPQGANQLRQRGFSGIFDDECAFWEEAESAYASAEPTIKGGGRMIMVSSRATDDGGFFKKIVFDQLDATNSNFPEIPPVKVQSPREGIEVWRNPKNEFLVVDLHYTANPAKRGDEFREALRRTLPVRKYRMEYEKSWDTFEGKPVYEDFNEQIHVTHSKPRVHVGLPLLLGWDSSGLTPAVVIAQMQEDTLFVVKEIVGLGMGAVRFVPHVAAEIRLHFPQITSLEQTISFIDPAGLKRSETNEQTYMQYIIAGGFKNVRPGPLTWEKRKEGVDALLVGLSRGQGKVRIYERECPILVAGFKGGYRYSDTINTAEPDRIRPIKDIHSHPHDGFQYLCGGIKAYTKTHYNIEIPTPNYGFQKTTDLTPKARRDYGR